MVFHQSAVPLDMDLIAGYGSGSDSDSGGHDRAQTASDGQPHQQMQSQPKAAASARKAVGLSLDADESSMPSTTTAALFSKLPQPSVATKRVVNFQVGMRFDEPGLGIAWLRWSLAE